MFVLCSDETDVNYWLSLSNVCSTYGINMSVFGNYYGINTATTSLTLLHNAGQEVSLDSWSQADLTATSLFQISTTNSNPAINISRSSKTLMLTCSNPAGNVTLNWSSADLTINDLKNAVSGLGWTITDSPNIGTDFTRLKALADSNRTSTTFPYTALVDVSPADNYPFWQEEVQDEINWFTSTLGWTPTTFAYPFGNNNPALQAYLRDVCGISGARTVHGSNGANYNLSSLNVYTIDCGVPASGGYFTTGTEADIRSMAGPLFILMQPCKAGFTAS